jgi:hypothetical protein
MSEAEVETTAGRDAARTPAVTAHLRARAALLALSAFVLVAFVAYRFPRAASGEDVRSALEAALRVRGVALAPGEELVWLSPARSALHRRPLVFLGIEDGGSVDVFFAHVRHDERMVFDVTRLSNLTRTGAAAEFGLRRSGRYAAYLTESASGVEAVTVMELAGEPEESVRGWPLFARLQNAITNFQDTGRFAGFGRIRYAFDEPVEQATLGVDGSEFVARLSNGRLVRLRGGAFEPVFGGEVVEAARTEAAQPGKITWVVDTVRRVSWIGPEPIAWLEHRVFGAIDWWDRFSFEYIGHRETDAEVVEQLGVVVEPTESGRRALAVVDPARGFPPPALRPVVSDPSDGEGEWIIVQNDPFVGGFPNAPPAFAQTHLRVDPDRPFARVFLVVWDPRMLQLRVMSGTREPESATGATGPGMIDRDPEVLTRVVAGFNGGFQAMHGEFGAMSDGQVYLPPKPYAATVGVYRDGRVAMGSWVGLPEGARVFSELAAVEQIPEGMFEFRQNLTSVVEDGRINPWRRWWWGSAPLNADEQVFVDRSGLCITEEGFMAYFWGRSMGADQLGDAMRAARCVRGMHLDMNVRHTAFEYYDVRRAEQGFPPLGRPLGEAEAEGPVPNGAGFVLRSRKMVRLMEPMRFPRYIGRDPRDFFYLLARPVLPGPAIAGAGEGEGVFDTHGLPHAGWPHAFARTHVGGAPGERVWLVRIDAARAKPAQTAVADGLSEAPTILAYLTGVRTEVDAADGPFGLYAERAPTGYRYAIGVPPSEAIRILMAPALEALAGANAALGVDPHGFLVYAERQPRARMTVADALARAGVTSAIALPDDVRLAFLADGQTVSPDEFERPVEDALALPIYASASPYTEILFPEVEPLPYGRWGALQDTRVRYVRPEEHVFRSTQEATPEVAP